MWPRIIVVDVEEESSWFTYRAVNCPGGGQRIDVGIYRHSKEEIHSQSVWWIKRIGSEKCAQRGWEGQGEERGGWGQVTEQISELLTMFGAL